MTCVSTKPDTFTVPLGAPISYTVRVDAGDPASYTATAKLKPIGITDYEPPDAGVESVADFSVTFVAASGLVPAHWIFSLTGAQCLAIGVGRFISDEKFSLGGLPQFITNPVIIVITTSVSG